MRGQLDPESRDGRLTCLDDLQLPLYLATLARLSPFTFRRRRLISLAWSAQTDVDMADIQFCKEWWVARTRSS
jgi:hypothetical protein